MNTKPGVALTLADRLADTMARALGAVLLLASALKLADPEPIVITVRLLLHVGVRDAPLVAASVGLLVAWELVLGTILLLTPRSRPALVALLATMLAFVGVTVVLAARPAGTPCGCFGSALEDATMLGRTMAIARNLCLLGASALLALRKSQRPTLRIAHARQPAATAALDDAPPTAPRAFTLIELLAVVAVVAILLGITMVALRGARSQGTAATSLATHRQLLVGIEAYSSDSTGFYPYLVTPGDPYAEAVIRGWKSVFGEFYFGVSMRRWPSVLVGTYLEPFPSLRFERNAQEMLYEPVSGAAAQPCPVAITQFWMSCTTAAAPAYWVGDEPPEDLSLFRAMRTTDVSSPSRKGLLLDVSYGFYTDDDTSPHADSASVGLCDGSASIKQDWNAFHDSAAMVQRPGHGAIPFPTMTTMHGVKGRDF